MSFNGADSTPGSPLNPSNTLGGSSSDTHQVTPADIAVIVGAVVVFALIVFGIFYYRHQRARREREEAEAEMNDLEMGSATAVGIGKHYEEDVEDGKRKRGDGDGDEGSVWRFGGWKEGEDGKSEGPAEPHGVIRMVSPSDVNDTPLTKPAAAYHAV